MKLDDIDLLDIGNKFQLSGCIYIGGGLVMLLPFPGELLPETGGGGEMVPLRLSEAEWERLLQQSDVCDTRGMGLLSKAILRKSQRQIDAVIQWKVFERDDFRCRYCGRRGPLSVDHVILWEEGGASTYENLISACKPCNRDRGNMPYEDWLRSATYRGRRMGRTREAEHANMTVLAQLPELRELKQKPRSR